MSAESSEYHQDQPPRSTINYVISTEVTDPSILESVADTVAGFINEVVPTSYTIPHDTTNEIQWAHLGQFEFDERVSTLSTIYEENSTPPLILVLGYNTGIQVWSVSANGLAAEVVPWRPGKTKVFRILPTPHKVESNCKDVFMSMRPLIALCDADSATGSCCTLDFVSFKNFKQVKSIKFRNNILDVQANKHSVVVSFLEKIIVLDAFTLRERCTVTLCPVIPTSPITLGLRWLAYTEKTSVTTKTSGGGCNNEGHISVTNSMIQCAKYIGQGLIDVGGSVVNSFTGSANFKPGVVCPGSPQSSGKSNIRQKGIVTILDIECDQVMSRDPLVNAEAVVAHFEAHNNPVASLKFDPSGMLLLTADVKGYDFHVFRIHPHPIGSSLSSVHHLYILHRGDTTSRVQDMCFSPDSRWVTVSTRRGTTHVFPITPYGGPVGVRTHTTKHVVNKMSRYHRSAGLTGENKSNNPSRSDTVTKIFPFANPRLSPHPKPTVVNALAQIKQPISIQTSGSVQLRSTNVMNPEDSNCIAVCFAAPRDCADKILNKSKKHGTIESLFIIAYHGSLIQYDLEPCPARNLARDRVCDDSPIELKTTPAAQWKLQRTPSVTDVQVPRKESYFEDIFSGVTKEKVVEQGDDYWLSQVEIVTHAGPHRRLWMGPQFTFKTYVTKPGSPLSITNVQNIEIRRTHQPSMAIAQVISFDPESHASREFSPPYQNFIDEIEVVGDVRLEEDLADALIEAPATQDSGLSRALINSNSDAFLPPPAEMNETGNEELPRIIRRDAMNFLQDFVIIQPSAEWGVNLLQILRREGDTFLEVPNYRNDLKDPDLQKALDALAERRLELYLADACRMPTSDNNDHFDEEFEREIAELIYQEHLIQCAVAEQELRPSLIGSHEIGVSQIDVSLEQEDLEQSKIEEEQKSKEEVEKEEELKREIISIVSQIDVSPEQENLEHSEKEEEQKSKEELKKEEELRREVISGVSQIDVSPEQENLEQSEKEEEQKSKEELEKEEELRREVELRREKELRIEGDLRRKEELRKAELGMEEHLRREAELRREEEFRTEKELRRQEMLRNIKLEEKLSREGELRREEELRREKELRRQEELRNIELRREEKLRREGELRREEELRREKELRRQEELRNIELRREEKLRREGELRREEELRREKGLRSQEELRTEKELRRQEELRREKEFRRQEELRNRELRREEKLRREGELRKEEELRREEQLSLRREDQLRREGELRMKEELRREGVLRKVEELRRVEQLRREDQLRREGELRMKEELRREGELRWEELRREDELRREVELRRKGKLSKKELRRQEDIRRRGREEALEQEHLEELKREIEMKRELELREEEFREKKVPTQLRREEDLRLQNELEEKEEELSKVKEILRQSDLKLQARKQESMEAHSRTEAIRTQEVKMEELLSEEIESRNQDLLRREEELRKVAELEKRVEYTRTQKLKMEEASVKQKNLRLDFSKVEELRKKDVLKMVEASNKQDELRREGEFKREAELKKQVELSKAEGLKYVEELRKEEELRRQYELRREEELRIEAELKKQVELRKAEELKREEVLRKQDELRREEEFKREGEMKKQIELRKAKASKYVDGLREHEELRRQCELIREAELKKQVELRKAEELKRKGELRKHDELIREEEFRREAELKKQVELSKAEELRKQDELIMKQELRKEAELKKQVELRKAEELKREEVLRNQDELRREEEFKREGEMKKQIELRKAKASKYVDGLREHEELRRQCEWIREAELKKQVELRKAEELKRKGELRKHDELSREEEFRREAELKKQVELSKAEELRKQDDLRRLKELRKQDELIRKEKLRKEAELKKQVEMRKAEQLKRNAELRKQDKLRREEECKREAELIKAEELKRTQKSIKEEEELRRKAKLKKNEQSKKGEGSKGKQEVLSKKERLKREKALKKMRAQERKSSSSSVKVATSSKSEGGAQELKSSSSSVKVATSSKSEGGGRSVIVSMKPHATPVAKVVNPLGKVVTIQSEGEPEREQREEAVIHENCDESLFRPIVAPKSLLSSEGKPRTNPTDIMMVRSLDDTTEVMVKILDKNIHSTNYSTAKAESRYSAESKYNVSPIHKSNKYSKEQKNYQTDIRRKCGDVVEDTPEPYNFSAPFESESKREISILDDMPPLENIDGALIFQESREDLKEDFDFPYPEDKSDVDKEFEFKTDMFEDASDCCDNLLYKNEENALGDVKKNPKTDVISEEKVVTAKTRKPKAKLGVRIPNKHFPTKNEDIDVWAPKNSWNSVANTKPKERSLDFSEKENCELLDFSESTKKSYTSAVKSVKLIHIETPADEEAAIEIVEPPLPEYRNNTWYPNIIEKSSDDEKNTEGSPGETTESDDSGKLLENQVSEDLTSTCVIQTVSKTNKKKSKKKRK